MVLPEINFLTDVVNNRIITKFKPWVFVHCRNHNQQKTVPDHQHYSSQYYYRAEDHPFSDTANAMLALTTVMSDMAFNTHVHCMYSFKQFMARAFAKWPYFTTTTGVTSVFP